MDENDICEDYADDSLIAKGLSKVVSFAIVLINFILRTVVMLLIEFIGYYTESEQTLNIKSTIFIT